MPVLGLGARAEEPVALAKLHWEAGVIGSAKLSKVTLAAANGGKYVRR